MVLADETAEGFAHLAARVKQVKGEQDTFAAATTTAVGNLNTALTNQQTAHGNLVTALSNEITARGAADDDLQAQIDGIEVPDEVVVSVADDGAGATDLTFTDGAGGVGGGGGSGLMLLGDQFDGVQAGHIPSTKAQVSLTTNAFDGYTATGAKLLKANQMYDVAVCNWNDQVLTPYGTAHMLTPKSSSQGTCFEFTTMFEGTYMCIAAWKIPGVKQDFRLWIDDIEVTDWYQGTRAAGTLQTGKPIINYTGGDSLAPVLNINFPQRGFYKIRFSGAICTGTTALIACNAEGSFHKPKQQRRFAVISDSWYDTIPTHTSLNAASTLAARMGWSQWNLAVGGSGFSNPSGAANGPHTYGGDAVFAALAKAPELDLLLVNGSCNDMFGGNTVQTTAAAMEAFFDRWRTVRPDTPIVWQGYEPVHYFENIYTLQAIIDRENYLADVALADENVIGVIRPALENWITGTGSTNAPAGNGNQDWVIGPDGVHLSDYGTGWNGRMVYENMSEIPTWRTP